MTPNKISPLSFWFWRRRAWRESKMAAYVRVCIWTLPEREALARIGKYCDFLVARRKMRQLLPSVSEEV